MPERCCSGDLQPTSDKQFPFFQGLCTQRQDMDILVLLSPMTAHMPNSYTPAVHAKLNWFSLGDLYSMSEGQD